MEKCNANLISHTNDAQTPDAYDEIAHVRVPPGYADHPEDERILLFPHTHERLVLWRFIILPTFVKVTKVSTFVRSYEGTKVLFCQVVVL